MKKCLLIMMVLLAVTVSAAALADTQTDWNQQCVLKTSAATSVYVWHSTAAAASPTDLADGVLDPVRTLMAGTYIKRSADDAVCATYGMAKISYCLTGSVMTGYIEKALVTSATARVRLSNGQYVNVPEALLLDHAALNKYLWAHHGMGMATGQATEGTIVDAADPGDYTLSYILVDEEDDSITTMHAEMVTPGLAWSVIRVEGEERIVPTSDLEWSTVADSDHILATINAPKTGKATIYANSSAKSKELGKVQAGRVVLVQKVGTRLSRIWCDGMVGFVLTSVLEFHSVMDASACSTAVVIKNGLTDGRAKINVRITNKANTRVVIALPTGTPVIVTRVVGSWSEIDVNGFHGFIQSKHLQEGTAP